MSIFARQVKFSPGNMVITPGALQAFHANPGDRIVPLLLRHVIGDWGDLDAEDRQVNEYALTHGQRLLSAYRLSDGTKLWFITDCGYTTILLPEEY